MTGLELQERIDVPRWPMMEVRKQTLAHGEISRLTLCCHVHKHVYAQYDVTDTEWEFIKSRHAIFERMATLAGRGTGWLWHIRDRMSALGAGDAGVEAFADGARGMVLSADENAIGWPRASASKVHGRIDEITCGFGVGAGARVGVRDTLFLNKWCRVRSVEPKDVLVGQAFVANVKQSLIGVLEKNKDNEATKKIMDQMRRSQGRIVEDVWRMPVYETVEALCSLRFGGVEVFHADEEMTWTMFLNKRRS